MPFRFNRGDIFQAAFPYEEDETLSKKRTIFIWGLHPNGQEVLASKITGSIGKTPWEVVLEPGTHSGLTKRCAVQVNQTRFISITACLFPRGTLNPFEIQMIEVLYREYLAMRKTNESNA